MSNNLDRNLKINVDVIPPVVPQEPTPNIQDEQTVEESKADVNMMRLQSFKINKIYQIRRISQNEAFQKRFKFFLSLTLDILVVAYLIAYSIFLITDVQQDSSFIKWINLGLAITFRLVIIGIRVIFEYIVERVARSIFYAMLAAVSFIFSGHVMPEKDINLLIVAVVDLGVIIILLIYAVSIKCLSKRQNITLACRKAFNTVALILFISYCVFITTIAIVNHVQRQLIEIDYASSLFYSECFFGFLYIFMFTLNRLQRNGFCKCLDKLCCCACCCSPTE
eukprot:403341353